MSKIAVMARVLTEATEEADVLPILEEALRVAGRLNVAVEVFFRRPAWHVLVDPQANREELIAAWDRARAEHEEYLRGCDQFDQEYGIPRQAAFRRALRNPNRNVAESAYQGALDSGWQKIPIDALPIRYPARCAMRKAGIHTVSDLLAWSPDRLMKLPQFGITSLNDVRQELGYYGLSLPEDPQ